MDQLRQWLPDGKAAVHSFRRGRGQIGEVFRLKLELSADDCEQVTRGAATGRRSRGGKLG
jgi:hypothetical protein